MEVNLVTEGLKFMVLGMTTVFLFLLLLIWVLKIQAKLVQKFFPVKSTTASNSAAGTAAGAAASGTKDDAEVIAAITAAITDYRKH
jgi:oxaloacetate decarboxylase gamma subunit